MNRAERNVTLSRYISLLEMEEKRLKWITTSTSATNTENIEAAAKLKVITEKLAGAERELANFKSQSKR
jgi:hypothetical protein